MSRHRAHPSTWPFLIALAVLFALAVLAPRGWEPYARRQSMDWVLAQRIPRGEPTLAPDRVMLAARDVPSVEPESVVVEAPALPRTAQELTAGLGIAALPEPPVMVLPEERIAKQATAESLPASLAAIPLPFPELVQRPTPPQVAVQIVEAPARTPADVEAPTRVEEPLVIAPAEPAVLAPAVEPTTPPLVASLPRRDQPQPVALEQASTARELLQAEEANVTSAWWPMPRDLLQSLERLRWDETAGAWARDVQIHLEELARQDRPSSDRVINLLSELHDLTGELNVRLPAMGETPLSDELRRVGYALTRRLDLWSRVAEMGEQADAVAARPVFDLDQLQASLHEVRAATSRHQQGEQWRDYLLLDALDALAEQRQAIDQERQRQLIERVLARLDRGGFNAWQAQYPTTGPLTRLRQELRQWNYEQIDARQLLWHVEQYEETGLPSHARLVAQHFHNLHRSPLATEQEMAHELETNYRNANVRLSFTDALVNRLLPKQDTRSVPVNDVVLGHPTQGWSKTTTICNVRFIPDPHRVRMSLEARGAIFSQTYTASGPVTVFSDSDSSFVAAKELRLSMDGLETSPAAVSAATFPKLRKIQSKFDFLPLVRQVVQGVAKSEYEESQPQAEAEARNKIRREVRTRLDDEVSQQISLTNDGIKTKLIDPLVRLGLPPQLIESNTTEDRVTMRLRVAGEPQLAGHGPRPRAPSDSLASLQLHESVLNNVCQQLAWDGREMTFPQLCEHLAERLQTDIHPSEDDNLDDLRLKFAPENGLRIRLRDGRVGIHLSFALLAKGQQVWKDFEVRVFYKPDLTQPGAPLVRDGTVQLSGNRLNAGAQIALRGIFSKAFPAGRTFKLLPDRVVERKPGLAGLQVTQCDIRDGWIGIALADRSRTARLPALFQRR